MNDYVNPMELSSSRPETFVETVEQSRLSGVTRAIVNIERAMGIGAIEAPVSVTGLGRVSSGNVIPLHANEAEKNLEALRPVSAKRDQASTVADQHVTDQQAMVASSLQAVYAVHDGIASGSESPVMTSQDAQIITLPLRAEAMAEPQDMTTTTDGEQSVVVPFAPIPEVTAIDAGSNLKDAA